MVFVLLGLFAFSFGCTDDLTERTITRDVVLDDFDLADRAMSCGETSVDDLIAMAEGYEDWVERIKSVKIKSVWYAVTFNDNDDVATGSLWMEDIPIIRAADVLIGEGDIPAGPTTVAPTLLPFEEGAADIVQWYINHSEETFDYCAMGTSVGTINMTIEFSFKLAIVIEII